MKRKEKSIAVRAKMQELRPTIVELTRKGLIYPEIEAQLDLPAYTLGNWAKKYPELKADLKQARAEASAGGLRFINNHREVRIQNAVRAKLKLLDPKRRHIMEMARQGCTQAEIARKVGVSTFRLAWYLSEVDDVAREYQEILKERGGGHTSRSKRQELRHNLEQATALALEGKTCREIALALKVTRSCVNAWRARYQDFATAYEAGAEKRGRGEASSQESNKPYKPKVNGYAPRRKSQGEDEHDRRVRCRAEGQKHNQYLHTELKEGRIVAERISPKLTIYKHVRE